MNLHDIRDQLRTTGNPIVTGTQLAMVAGVELRTAHVYLQRMVGRGMVHHVERGKFALCEDVFPVATGVSFPSYISFMTALQLHHRVEQVIGRVFVATSVRRRDLTYLGNPIHFVTLHPDHIFGYRKVRQGGFDVFLADVEKAILDLLAFPRYGRIANVPEILRKAVDRDLLLQYADRQPREAVRRRLGYLLERAGMAADLHPRSRTPYLLNPSLPGRGRFDAKWRLYINEVVA